MGTRHLIAAVIDGDFKLAQYGQWDGYPTGQGADILKFLRSNNLEAFAGRVRNLRWATEDDHRAVSEEAGVEHGKQWVTMDESERLAKVAPYFDRGTGSAILDLIQEDLVPCVEDHHDFARNSLFCEWAYVLDLDEGVFEVYQGFQQTPPTKGRWVGQSGSDGYEPVELVASWPFTALPTDDEFNDAFSEED